MFQCSDGQAAPGYLVSSRATLHRPGPRAGLALPALKDSSNRAVALPLDWLLASASEPRLCLSWPRPRSRFRPRPRSRSPRVPPGRRRAWTGGAASPSLWRRAHRLPPPSDVPVSEWLRRAATLPNSSRLSAMPRPLGSPIGRGHSCSSFRTLKNYGSQEAPRRSHRLFTGRAGAAPRVQPRHVTGRGSQPPARPPGAASSRPSVRPSIPSRALLTRLPGAAALPTTMSALPPRWAALAVRAAGGRWAPPVPRRGRSGPGSPPPREWVLSVTPRGRLRVRLPCQVSVRPLDPQRCQGADRVLVAVSGGSPGRRGRERDPVRVEHDETLGQVAIVADDVDSKTAVDVRTPVKFGGCGGGARIGGISLEVGWRRCLDWKPCWETASRPR